MDSTNAQPSVQNPKINLVLDEINRGKKYSKILEQRQSCIKSKSDEAAEEAKRKYGLATDELYKQLYPDVYVERCIVPDYAPTYGDCRHIKRNVINRDVLNIKQHINLLAQPKFVNQRKVERPYIIRRKVPGPSHRILELARPKRRQTMETCKQYGATMQKFCIENCYRNIQDVTFVPVHDAVYFIKLNKRKPLIEKQKLQLRMKRLQERINEARMAKMQQMLRKLYLPLKGFLLAPLSVDVNKAPKCSKCVRGGKCAKCTKAARVARAAEDAEDPQVVEDAKKAREAQVAQDAQDDKIAKEIKVALDAKSAVDAEAQAKAAKDANAPLSEDQKIVNLSYVLRNKMVGLLDCTEKIEEDSQLNRFLVLVSDKLAFWMQRLLNSEVMEVVTEATEVITEVVEEVIQTVTTEVSTTVTQNVAATGNANATP